MPGGSGIGEVRGKVVIGYVDLEAKGEEVGYRLYSGGCYVCTSRLL
jgi:hypothetical protein